MTDDELIALARAATAGRDSWPLPDATVEVHGSQARVLLTSPEFSRGGGFLVVVDTLTGTVLRVVPQL